MVRDGLPRQGVRPDGRRGWSTIGAVVAVTVLLVVTVTGNGAGAQPQPAPDAADLGGGFQHGFVRVDGERIHFVRGGSGPPVVLLHGWPQTWWAWHDVMPDLARDHTVIAMDLPGLGRSTQPADGFDSATIAARLHRAVGKLGFSRVDLLTHDLGTLIAYPYAQQFPHSVNRAVVMEAPLNGFGLEDFYGISFHFLFNLAPEPIPEEIIDNDGDVEAYLGMLFNAAPDPDEIDQHVYFRAYADPDVRSAGYEYYRAFPENAAYNQANAEPKIATPVLAISGDNPFGAAVAPSFRNVAADVREVLVPGVFHFVPEEAPELVVDCVRLFLGPAGVPAPRPELAGCVA